jgi:hypothetical protein
MISAASYRPLATSEENLKTVAGSATASPGTPKLATVGVCVVYRDLRSVCRTPG